MANQLYPKWLQHLMEVYFGVTPHFSAAAIDVFVCGVGPGYTYDPAHFEVEDLGINVVIPPAPLLDVTLINGILDASDTETNTDDLIGQVVEAAVIFTANDDGSRLMAYIDTGTPTQLPLTLVNGKFFFRWNAAGIFRI